MARILLIEDNEMNRDMLLRRLTRAGTRCWSRSTGNRARPRAADAPDLIVMDMMPAGDRRVAGDAAAQAAGDDAGDPGDRADVARDVRRP